MTVQIFGPSGARAAHLEHASALRLDGPFALTFAGQASEYLDELGALRAGGGAAGALVEELLATLESFVAALPPQDRALFTEGFAARAWLAERGARPSPSYLQSVMVSFPLIFVTQLGHYERLRGAGLARVPAGAVRLAAGHSQGLMAAVAVSLAGVAGPLGGVARVLAPLGLLFALRMQQAWPARLAPPHSVEAARRAGLEPPTAMAAVTGLLRDELDALLARFGEGVECTLDNTLLRQVLSAEPERLERFRERLFAACAERRKLRKERRVGGRAPEPQWQYLPVSAPFHSVAMASAMPRLYADAAALGFRWKVRDLSFPVLDTERAAPFGPDDDLLERLVTLQCVRPVRWRALCDAIATSGARAVLDCGPGDALSKLTHSNLRGAGLSLWPVAVSDTLAALGSERAFEGARAAERDRYPAPSSVDGAADNVFTRLASAPPVLLAGMTPTTVEAPLVAAAANAGFVAELAGGGQVTEALLRSRLDELRGLLEPGRSVVFNALHLDPYLWKLHFGGARPLVLRLIEEGYPLRGVTVSAGVPPREEAVTLWRALHRVGATLNSLKPGNDRELGEALALADAVPELPVIVQLEGGHAGGHHSWEDLNDLLLRHYASVRARRNVLLAVGGGIGTPAQAARYLDGTWAGAFGSRPMPVDAVFLGTAAMACLEAATSPSVKRALVAARGTQGWVADGASEGGVTSGRSQLDASIYYLDTSAARAGRLLDELAGDEGAVLARRDELIAALARTARPYFGDVEALSYAQWLERLRALTAVGRHGRYDDGPWPDRSYRERFLASLRLAEARLASGEGAFASLFDESALDDPARCLARLQERYPECQSERVHPRDALAFVALCRAPGKPVNFVPRLDGEARRWFKADSLWPAHDERYEADQVLALPGPRSVAAIERVDEPVGELLARFASAMSAALPARPRTRGAAPAVETLVPLADELAAPLRWLTRLSGLDDGPVCSMLRALRACDPRTRRWSANPLRALLVARPGLRVRVVRGTDGDVTVLHAEEERLEGARLRLSVTARECTARSYGPEGREAVLDLGLAWAGRFLAHDRERYVRAQGGFYQQLLFGRSLAETRSFEPVRARVHATRPALEAFALATGDQPGRLLEGPMRAPLTFAFALLWEPLFGALAGVQPEVTRLVHEELELDAGPAWCALEGAALEARAAVVALDGVSEGLRVTICGTLSASAGLVARVTTRFLVRDSAVAPSREHREAELWERRLLVRDEATATLLREQQWLNFTSKITAPATLVLRCETLAHHGDHATARGALTTLEGALVATVHCDERGAVREHPVRALAALLAPPESAVALDAPRSLLEVPLRAPRSMEAYALASGDRNPLHLDASLAVLGGLEAPIVHGLWTASAAACRALEAAHGAPGTLTRLAVRFESPAALEESLTLRVECTALRDGAASLALLVRGHDDERSVLRGTAEVAAPRTAYLFPGQGIQRKGMGMPGYARSAAARARWDEADAHCRTALGFSLLRVVRDNPSELEVRGERFVHPQGVLFLTQFTQVALVVLAVAQVAELRASGAFVPDAMLAGHSLGEYSALTAVAGVVPLRAAVEVVYERGLTMDRLVERDERGRTRYAMSVVRPHVARLDHEGLSALVAESARDGEPLEIVNYNVRGRQYAITGDVAALDRLGRAVAARCGPEQAARALAPVPGVDVPFHSTLLRGGVERFRATLERALPAELDATGLVGRYVPNLTGRFFTLERDALVRLRDELDSAPLGALVCAYDELTAAQRSRALLVELLAYQFASPVRWIDTQELLFASGLERCIEVGLAEQPTLCNLAGASLAVLGLDAPRVLNSELHAEQLLGPPSSQAPTPPPARLALVPVPAASAPSASRPSPSRATGSAPADVAFAVRDGLRVLLALQARVRLEQLRDEQNIDELLGGNSARRNQLLADLGQEFEGGAPDGAHEQPLRALGDALTQRAPRYVGFGRYLGPSVEQRVSAALGPARVAVADVQAHLTGHWNLGPGGVRHVLARLALDAREGDSTRGGPLSQHPPGALADRAAALRWVDDEVAQHAAAHNLALAPAGSDSSAVSAVDSAALAELESRVLGPAGVLARAGTALLRSLGQQPLEALAAPERAPSNARLEAFEREHDDRYLELTAGLFVAGKHVALTSASVWLRHALTQSFFDAMAGDAIDDSLAARLDDEARAAARALSARARALHRADVAAAFEALADAPRTVRERAPLALVTGAGPGSIALALVARLLARGARVVVTTSSYGDERLGAMRALYRAHAAPGAELHLVPFNQGSLQDVDALTTWLAAEGLVPDLLFPFAALGETATLAEVGARSLATLRIQLVGVHRLLARLGAALAAGDDLARRCHCVLPLSPNHGLFGGDGLYGESKAALEVLLTRWRSEHHAWGRHFTLAGARIGWVRGTGLMAANDGLADALEREHGLRSFSAGEMADALLALCEPEARQRAAASPLLEDLTAGFDSLGDLAVHAARARARTEAERSTRRTLDELRAALAARTRTPAPGPAMLWPAPRERVHARVPSARELAALPPLDHLMLERLAVVVGYGEVSPWGSARTRWEAEQADELSPEALHELAWMCGLVETGPDGALLDRATRQPVERGALRARYADAVRARSGLRVVQGAAAHGFDPARMMRHTEVHADEPLEFTVASPEHAERFRAADPERVRVERGADGRVRVRLEQGARVRVATTASLRRLVVGQVPEGWDATRYGVPKALVEQVDRVTLYNLVATVEAFLAAGLEPEELYAHLHPGRVACTQSSGIGGMQKLRRLYHDPLLDRERQSDVLQETLVNVLSGWMVQSYLGSYGPISAPVGACATAALSIAAALDVLATGRADFVVTGGCDDYNEEGAVGFADMGATADSVQAEAHGITAGRLSRPNDRRRAGFVEAHGAGALLVTRASIALELGLPVYGVLAYAASFSDGINASVPAPGQGILAAAAETREGEPKRAAYCRFDDRRAAVATLAHSRDALTAALGAEQAELVLREGHAALAHEFHRNDPAVSPLRGALGVFGLGADDVAFVSKHDTSTQANDLNEARLHARLAERLGRTHALPLPVVSQKSLTGHSKGAAAAWQLIGAMQAMRDGVVPGNRSLEDVAPALRDARPLSFSELALRARGETLRAALVTSLGFGHVGALVCVLHPFFYWRALSDEQRARYEPEQQARLARATSRLRRVLAGTQSLYTRRAERPFVDKEGSEAHARHEAEVLLDAGARRTAERYPSGELAQ